MEDSNITATDAQIAAETATVASVTAAIAEIATEAARGSKADKPAAQESVPATTSFFFPVDMALAALSCASNDETRYYLNGLHLCRRDNAFRIEATNGHRLFIWQSGQFVPEAIPAWLTAKGIILSSVDLGARLKMIQNAVPKAERQNVTFTVELADKETRPTIYDFHRTMSFRHTLVDGSFPEVDRVLPADCFGDRNFEAGTAPTFNAKYMREAGALAASIGASGVNMFTPADEGPSVFTFAGVPTALLVLMPLKNENKLAIASETAAIMPNAMKLTLAALRAHYTRNEEALAASTSDIERTQYRAKMESFDQRIKAILAGTMIALPPADKKAAKAELAKAKKAAAAQAKADRLAKAQAEKAERAAAQAATKAAKASRKPLRLTSAAKSPRGIGRTTSRTEAPAHAA